MSATTPRIGVLRPSTASHDPVVALAEARIVRHELTRRLGEVSIDFRNEGAVFAPWLPVEHGAWPSDVDATIDLTPVTGPEGPRLLSVFARTVDPTAADVRRRMLTHLGVLPVDLLDDAELQRRLPTPQRPTDVWLLVNAADRTDLSDPRVGALRGDARESAAIDVWYDECVAGLPVDITPTVIRLTARIDELEVALADAQSEAARSERLALERLDELQTAYDVLRERLVRTELDRGALDEADTS
jgi:hypothetical protein